MRSSIPLYDSLAAEFDTGFYDVPHRRAYDQLAWERVSSLLPKTPATIIDAGCGTGRWVSRLLPLGHRVIGIEQSPEMIKILERKRYGPQFTLIEGLMENATLDPASADAVLAMGSLPFVEDPALMIQKFASWTKPGGLVAILTDSVMALVLELLNTGKEDEALDRLETRRAVWRQHGHEADLHLLDRQTLETYFADAGLDRVTSAGLLVTASAWGVPRCKEAVATDESKFLQLERQLAADPALTDAGKQILITGYKR